MTRHTGSVWHILAALLIAGGVAAGTGAHGDAAISLSPANFGRQPIVDGRILTHGSVSVLDLARL